MYRMSKSQRLWIPKVQKFKCRKTFIRTINNMLCKICTQGSQNTDLICATNLMRNIYINSHWFINIKATQRFINTLQLKYDEFNLLSHTILPENMLIYSHLMNVFDRTIHKMLYMYEHGAAKYATKIQLAWLQKMYNPDRANPVGMNIAKREFDSCCRTIRRDGV